jgi:outer membrane protein assembly factor BamB
VYNGVVYFGSFDRKLYAVNATDGSPKWKEPFMGGNWFWSQPVIVNDTLYAGCLDGSIYALKPSTGELVTVFPIGSQVASQPVVFDNYVIFASHNGVVYKIDSTTQEIIQIAAFSSTIDGPLTINEGIVYFQTHDAALQRIDLQSGALLPSIPLVSQ